MWYAKNQKSCIEAVRSECLRMHRPYIEKVELRIAMDFTPI